jgi:hypothetical protein
MLINRPVFLGPFEEMQPGALRWDIMQAADERDAFLIGSRCQLGCLRLCLCLCLCLSVEGEREGEGDNILQGPGSLRTPDGMRR